MLRSLNGVFSTYLTKIQGFTRSERIGRISSINAEFFFDYLDTIYAKSTGVSFEFSLVTMKDRYGDLNILLYGSQLKSPPKYNKNQN